MKFQQIPKDNNISQSQVVSLKITSNSTVKTRKRINPIRDCQNSMHYNQLFVTLFQTFFAKELHCLTLFNKNQWSLDKLNFDEYRVVDYLCKITIALLSSMMS